MRLKRGMPKMKMRPKSRSTGRKIEKGEGPFMRSSAGNVASGEADRWRDDQAESAEREIAHEVEEAQARPAHHAPTSVKSSTARTNSSGASSARKCPASFTVRNSAPGIAWRSASRSATRDQS